MAGTRTATRGGAGHALTGPSWAAAAAASTGMVTGAGAPEMAHSGSLRPLPVTVQTTRWPGSSSPAAATCSRPATEAAEAGSTKTASLRASSR